jgi:hypothetical protein
MAELTDGDVNLLKRLYPAEHLYVRGILFQADYQKAKKLMCDIVTVGSNHREYV